MFNILAILESETTEDGEVYQHLQILYEADGVKQYEFFARWKREEDTCCFVANGNPEFYGDLSDEMVSIHSENPNVYKLIGLRHDTLWTEPTFLTEMIDVKSYLKEKYAGYIGELEELLEEASSYIDLTEML